MKINPCPKCGREPKVYCGEALINGDTYKQAVTKWNEMTKGETND